MTPSGINLATFWFVAQCLNHCTTAWKLRVKTGNKCNKKIVNIFQNPKWKQEYAIEINNRFEMLANMDDEDDTDKTIDEKLESIKTIIEETKQQLIEKDGSMETVRNKWL
jgi:hypothetical protein